MSKISLSLQLNWLNLSCNTCLVNTCIVNKFVNKFAPLPGMTGT
jgi:hypothetical protein